MLSYIHVLKNVIFKPLTMGQFPIHIQVEHTTYCNLNCKTCDRADHITTPKHLKLEDVKSILAQIHPQKISLSGNGEPFLHPNMIEIVSLAKDQGCSVNTTTNGTVLTPEGAEQIVKSGLDLLKISIDGATQDTFRRVRGADKFLEVLDGIRALAETKKRLSSLTPFIRLNFVMTNHNYHEIPGIVELADKVGGDGVFFQVLDLLGIEDRKEALVGDLTYETFAQTITQSLAISEKLGVNTNLPSIHKDLKIYWEKYQGIQPDQLGKRVCILPWFHTYISVDGDVRPCCYFKYGQYGNMRNILENSIEEIWNGSQYQNFRHAMRQGKRLFPACKQCMGRTFSDIVSNLLFAKVISRFFKSSVQH